MSNRDRCYKYDEITPELLKQFSEGCESLENLLNCCYEHEIETRACCAGHEEIDKIHTPYVSFIVHEHQNDLMESMINILLSLTTLSQHVKASVSTNKNDVSLTIRLNSFDKELMDLFFNSTSKTISGIIKTQKDFSGKFKGLFEAYKSLDSSNNTSLDIDSSGISVYEAEDTYFKFTENDMIEVPKEEADIHGKKAVHKQHVAPEKIAEFISSSKTKNQTDTFEDR